MGPRLSRSRLRPAIGAGLLAVTSVVAGQLVRPAAADAVTPTPVLSRTVIGWSVQHRPIVAYHLGNPAVRTVSLIVGQMHGDEHAGVVVANSIIHGKVSVEGVNLWVIPTMNPDGDAAHTRQNAHKVDLNRNWPDHWRHLTGQYYSGRKPLSEPETRAMYAFLNKLHAHYLVVLHQPLHGVDSTDGGRIAKGFRNALARNLHLPIKAFNCWSRCYGSMTGMYTTRHMGIGETIEFGWHPPHGYLVSTARKGIVAALHGHFGSLAAHDPRYRVSVTAAPGKAEFAGWAYDIDNRSAHLTYRIYEGTRLLATRRAWAPPQSHHGISAALGTTAGRHTYCTVITNVGAGTKDPRTCATVQIPAP